MPGGWISRGPAASSANFLTDDRSIFGLNRFPSGIWIQTAAMSFTPDFLDELRGRLRLSEVVGRKVKLVRRGREYTGLCPFHSEKTPSFTVNDDKAFYHCFGCGAHGDAIRFLTDSEGLAFPEAVERLANEAGLTLPARDPAAESRARERAGLRDVQAMAAKWFESQLWSTGGADALAYLRRRGLDDVTIRRFGLGYAPGGRTALLEALRARGLDDGQLKESGLIVYPEDGRSALDRFRNRVMFPIRDGRPGPDGRGAVIAFGGRALDDSPAKYMNSPETPLFHKGRTLYNLDLARGMARDKGRIIVVEGYMDVIALSAAGFGEAVAPLGTALTEDQLQVLWRVVPEPILCFDGDTAGLRAAARSVERALPLLKPGYSLDFAILPAGEDPDSLVQANGADAFTQVLDQARSLSDMLWDSLTNGISLDTPERRAGLERTVMMRLGEIADAKVQSFYRDEFRARLRDLFAPAKSSGMVRGGPDRPGGRNYAGGRNYKDGAGSRHLRGGAGYQRTGFGAERAAVESRGRLRATNLGHDGTASRARRREQLLLLCLLNHPALIEPHLEEIVDIELLNPDLDKLRNEIIRIAALHDSLDMEGIKRHLKALGLERLLNAMDAAFRNLWFVQPEAALKDVQSVWRQASALHHRSLTMERELRALERELAEDLSEETFARFIALKTQIDQDEGLEANLEDYGVASGRRGGI